jgi:hypothetical protein
LQAEDKPHREDSTWVHLVKAVWPFWNEHIVGLELVQVGLKSTAVTAPLPVFCHSPVVPLDLLSKLVAWNFCSLQLIRKGWRTKNCVTHCSWWHGTASPLCGAPAVPCITCYSYF